MGGLTLRKAIVGVGVALALAGGGTATIHRYDSRWVLIARIDPTTQETTAVALDTKVIAPALDAESTPYRFQLFCSPGEAFNVNISDDRWMHNKFVDQSYIRYRVDGHQWSPRGMMEVGHSEESPTVSTPISDTAQVRAMIQQAMGGSILTIETEDPRNSRANRAFSVPTTFPFRRKAQVYFRVCEEITLRHLHNH